MSARLHASERSTVDANTKQGHPAGRVSMQTNTEQRKQDMYVVISQASQHYGPDTQ